MIRHALIVIGGGPAGLAAAIAAYKGGVRDILIIEREKELGGILNQCIHNGFGLHRFGEELTGPEYAQRFVAEADSLALPRLTDAMVVDLTSERVLTVCSAEHGMLQIQADAIILAMGCRERARGALNIPGTRPAGIFSAGTAQRLINIEGEMPGREAVILGSGDIGLIMARRLTLSGAHVRLVAEVMPYSGGLKRNIVQCLDDFGIPLKLSHTVVRINGDRRLESVVIAQVDDMRRPIPGTEETVPCDTLLLSVGLLPENELSAQAGVQIDPATQGPIVDDRLETGVKGIFACGNVLHVHDLVDNVSEEAEEAGAAAARYLLGSAQPETAMVQVEAGAGVGGIVPQRFCPESMPEQLVLRFRVRRELRNASLCVYADDKPLVRRKKRILTPGQMEELALRRDALAIDVHSIRIAVEEAEQ